MKREPESIMGKLRKQEARRPVRVRKPLRWIGSSLEDLSQFPGAVKKAMGHALHLAQMGQKAPSAKPLRGYQGAGVLEVVEDHVGDTYRAVYTVRFPDAIYALHAFQKKSKKGIATPKHELDLIEARLKAAEDDHEERRRKNP
jgi:phage-related protein